MSTLLLQQAADFLGLHPVTLAERARAGNKSPHIPLLPPRIPHPSVIRAPEVEADHEEESVGDDRRVRHAEVGKLREDGSEHHRPGNQCLGYFPDQIDLALPGSRQILLELHFGSCCSAFFSIQFSAIKMALAPMCPEIATPAAIRYSFTP